MNLDRTRLYRLSLSLLLLPVFAAGQLLPPLRPVSQAAARLGLPLPERARPAAPLFDVPPAFAEDPLFLSWCLDNLLASMADRRESLTSELSTVEVELGVLRRWNTDPADPSYLRSRSSSERLLAAQRDLAAERERIEALRAELRHAANAEDLAAPLSRPRWLEHARIAAKLTASNSPTPASR